MTRCADIIVALFRLVAVFPLLCPSAAQQE